MNDTTLIDEFISRYSLVIHEQEFTCRLETEIKNTDALIFSVITAENNLIPENEISLKFKEIDTQFFHVDKSFLRECFSSIVMGKKPSAGFEFLRLSGLLKLYFPWLDKCYGVEQNEYHAHDVYYHLIYSCDAAVCDSVIRMAALFHDAGKVRAKRKIQKGEDEKDVFYNHEIIGSTITYKTLRYLEFEDAFAQRVSRLVRHHMFHYTSDWSNNAVRRFIRNMKDDLKDLFKLRNADRCGNGKRISTPGKLGEFKRRIMNVIEIDNRLSVKDLEINGNDLMKEFQLSPGPQIGNLLKLLLKYVEEDEENNTRDFLLLKAAEFIKNGNISNHS